MSMLLLDILVISLLSMSLWFCWRLNSYLQKMDELHLDKLLEHEEYLTHQLKTTIAKTHELENQIDQMQQRLNLYRR